MPVYLALGFTQGFLFSTQIYLGVPFIPNLFAPFLFSRRRHDDVVIPAKLVHSRKRGAGIQIFSPLHRRGFPTSRDYFIPDLNPTQFRGHCERNAASSNSKFYILNSQF